MSARPALGFILPVMKFSRIFLVILLLAAAALLYSRREHWWPGAQRILEDVREQFFPQPAPPKPSPTPEPTPEPTPAPTPAPTPEQAPEPRPEPVVPAKEPTPVPEPQTPDFANVPAAVLPRTTKMTEAIRVEVTGGKRQTGGGWVLLSKDIELPVIRVVKNRDIVLQFGPDPVTVPLDHTDYAGRTREALDRHAEKLAADESQQKSLQSPTPRTAAGPSATREQAAANPSGYVWNSVVMGGAGFVSGVLAHPTEKGLLYARTDVGGAYRWNPADESWIPLLDWLPPSQASALGIEAMAVDPQDPGRIYMLAGTPYWKGGTSVLRSFDRGATWDAVDVSDKIRAHGNKAGRHTGERLAVDPNDGRILFCGARNSGLWKSADAGKTWDAVEGFAKGPSIMRKDSKSSEHPATTNDQNGVSAVVFDPATGKPGSPTRTLYAALSRPYEESYEDASGNTVKTPDGNIFRSTDGGTTWAPLPPLPAIDDKEISPRKFFKPARMLVNGGRLFVTFQGEKGGGIFRFDPAEKGGEWADITPMRGGRSDQDRLYHSYGGLDIAPGPNPRMVASTYGIYHPQPSASGRTVYGDQIFLSEAGPNEKGHTWINLFGDRRARLGANIPFAARTTIHWGSSIVLDPSQPDRAFITSGNGIWRTDNLDAASRDGKKSEWIMSVKGLEESVPLDIVSIPGGPLVSVILDYAGFVHDDPKKYPEAGPHNPGAGSNYRLAAAGAGQTAKVVRLTSPGQLFFSENSGREWAEINHGLGKGAKEIGISADGNTLVMNWKDQVFRSEDPKHRWEASTWEEIPALKGAQRPIPDPVNPKVFYAVRGSDLLVSTDGARTFKSQETIGQPGGLLEAAPGRQGDVWMPLRNGGIARVLDGRVKEIDVLRCIALGFGRGEKDDDYPAVYIWGKPREDDPVGVYRSTNTGKSWQRVNDDLHQYGGLGNGGFVRGDANVFGRVYMSTAGRGIACGTPAVSAGE